MTWGYSRDNGPDRWADLDNAFEVCRIGRMQSPIDLSRPIPADLKPVEFDYWPTVVSIADNGNTVMATCDSGSGITIAGKWYSLVQFHFHAPSEHSVGGELLDGEMHLVHSTEAGELAVVGVFITRGSRNAAYAPVWSAMPAAQGDPAVVGVPVDIAGLLPPDRQHFRYEGSLTTPPCTEGVVWAVMRTPVEASTGELARFAAIHRGNNRPVQPANGRPVYLSR